MSDWNSRILNALESAAGGQAQGVGWNERVASSLEIIAEALTLDATFDTTVAGGSMYIPVWVSDITNENCPRYSFCRVAGKPGYGIKMLFEKIGNVWVQEQAWQGRLVKAFYPAFADLVAGSGVTLNEYKPGSTTNWVKVYTIGADESCTWTVPAGAAGMDKVVLPFQYQTIGGVWSVSLTRDEETSVLDTFDTLAVLTSYVNANERTITVEGGLLAGDVITVSNTSEAGTIVQVGGIWAYESEATPAAGDVLAVVGDLAAVTSEHSSIEMAQQMAPTGSALKFFGAHHQGDANGLQVNVSETFEVNGSTTPLATGYMQGYIVQTRTSKAYYDESNPDIATITETYIYDGGPVQHYAEIEPSVAIDGGLRYPAMLALPTPIGKVYSDGPAYDLSGQAVNASWYFPSHIETVKVSGVIEDCLVCMKIGLFTHGVESCFVKRTPPPTAAEDNQKFYWDIGSVSNSTAPWSGGWTFWVQGA